MPLSLFMVEIVSVMRLGIPMKKSTRSDAWRPPVPIDDDQMAWVHGDTVGCIC